MSGLSNEELKATVADLAQLRREPRDAPELLRRALDSGSPYAQARAVAILAEQQLDGFDRQLLRIYAGAFINPAKSDPGCHLKVSIAEALDFRDHDDAAPFLKGVVHRQFETGHGKPTDVAGALRARCGLALVRMRYPKVLLHLADLLSDGEANVRSAAATAIAYHGDEKGAHLLRLKLHHSDAEPEVITDTLKAYLEMDPAEGLAFARTLLGSSGPACHGALSALGESRLNEAFPLLVRFLDSATLEEDLYVACLALGTLRTNEARTDLLERIETGSSLRATCALRGLALFLGDAAVPEDARRAESRNSSTDLGGLIERLFPSDQ